MNNRSGKTGIVIGRVQSGKTSNFLTLTALAFDNGYRVVILLGGTTKVLVAQNSERINEYIGQNNEDVCVLNTIDHAGLIKSDKIRNFINSGKKIVIVALKKPVNIKKIKNDVFLNDSLSGEPVIIIDDEGDEASLNTLVKQGKESATYREIKSLKNTLTTHAYISITATPQANLLIEACDILSPDFGVLVDPGQGYCGLDTFHGKDDKYIHYIKEEDIVFGTGVPQSLELALFMFFVGAALNRYRFGKGRKFSMLIHPSHKKDDHSIVYAKVDQLISRYAKMAENKDDLSYSTLRTKLNLALTEYKKMGTYPDLEIIEDTAIDVIKSLGLHKINGDSVDRNADKFYDYNIYIGGNLLGRGLTLKGLAITYIVRTSQTSSNVDTIEQRARWFGYKKDYLDLCRVFAIPKILREFAQIRHHEEDLWDTLKKAENDGIEFKYIPRVFTLSENLNLTRSNVARSRRYTFNYWNFQRHYQTDPDFVKNNYDIVKMFMAKYSSNTERYQYGEGRPNLMIPGISFKELKRDVLDNLKLPDDSKLNKGFISLLDTQLDKKSIVGLVDVVWIRFGEPAIHPVVDGLISEYMSGRRPDDYDKPAKYLGDRVFEIKPDRMQLQIHEINAKDTSIVSLTFALYLPTEYIEQLTGLVTRDTHEH